jgi:hypothetical protein
MTKNRQNMGHFMALTDTEIKKAKPLQKDYQMGDSKGLSLIFRKKGDKDLAL